MSEPLIACYAQQLLQAAEPPSNPKRCGECGDGARWVLGLEMRATAAAGSCHMYRSGSP